MNFPRWSLFCLWQYLVSDILYFSPRVFSLLLLLFSLPSCWGQGCRGQWASSYVSRWLLAGANPSLYRISCPVTTVFAMWPDCLSCDLTFFIIWEDMEATPDIYPESDRGLGYPPEEELQSLRRGRQTEHCHTSQLVHSLYPAHHMKEQATGWLDKLICRP